MNKSKKNILVSIDWFLPGTNAGGPVTSMVNLVEQLEEFNFYILTSDTDYCAAAPYPTISANEWVTHAEHVSVYYFSAKELNKTNMQAVMESVDTDTIYINGIFSKYFSRWPLQIANKLNLRTIVASRGMLSPHGLAVKALKKKLFLQLVNTKNTYKNIHFHATNVEEKEAIQQVVKKYKHISAIPNFPRKVEHHIQFIHKKKQQVHLISLGRIAIEKGTMVSLKALSKINGSVILHLYGTIYDENYWKECQAIIQQLPKEIQVDYRGALASNDVMQTLQQYHFLLLPSKGENYGHAIVESFMANRPVIISKNTPWKNLVEKQMGYDVEESDLSQTLQTVVDMNQDDYNAMCKSIHANLEDVLEIAATKRKYQELFGN